MEKPKYLQCGICLDHSPLLMSGLVYYKKRAKKQDGLMGHLVLIVHTAPMCEECMEVAVQTHVERNYNIAQVRFAVPPPPVNESAGDFTGGIVS